MKKILLGLVGLIVLVIAGLAIAVLTFDADKYRAQLVEMLSKQTGRTVKLGGPIKLGLSLDGASLTIQDASISNPEWASRKDMAGIGHFELGVALIPLLSHQLIITDLKIVNADIQLESSAEGKNNWDMAIANKGDKTEAKIETTKTEAGKPITIQANNISIKDSQFAIRGSDGKTTLFKTKSLTYVTKSQGIEIKFDGAFNNAPIQADLQTGTKDLMADKQWPFALALTYDNYAVTAKGDANAAAKKFDIANYSAKSGNSEIHGKLNINLSGTKPSIKGALLSAGINPDDFKPAAQSGSGTTQSQASESGARRVFSDAPLPFDALKSADADMDIKIDALTSGGATLNNVVGNINLQSGRLDAPVKATLGKNTVTIGLKIDGAAKPPQVAFIFNAPRVDIEDLLDFIHAPAVISGLGNANINIRTEGYSMHNLAYGANGIINVIADSGEVSGAAAGGIAKGLMSVLTPNGSSAMNCLAARFNIQNGIAKDNGILLDSAATTVQGKGGFNLGTETIDMMLTAKPKIVNIGSAIPPLKIGGGFTAPSFSVDGSAVVQNVVGVLTSGSLSGLTSSTVPDVKPVSGQNACVYVLDHPAAQATQPSQNSGVLVPGVGGQINRLKDGGGALLKGLLGQ